MRDQAARFGTDLQQYAKQRLSLPVPAPENMALIALLRQWRIEDAAMTTEEAERADEEWNRFQASINANRALNGEEPIY